MDLKKLNQIVKNFIDKNKYHIETLPQVVEYSKQVYSEKMPDTNNEWSRKIEINESINIIYEFLKTIDMNIANQFLNIINNNPLVNILPKTQYPNGKDEVTKEGRVYIYYDNTPNDIFNILHEMLHKMNENYTIDNNNEQQETMTRNYFGETVSILGEMILGNYMLENKIITENDFNIRKKFRLKEAQEDARDVIIENELVQMKLSKKDIDYQNLINLINNYNKNSIEYEILNDEKNDLSRINNILKNQKLNFRISQKYVIAQVLTSEMLKRNTLVEDFIKLHYAVGDINSNIEDVYNEILKNKTY